MYSMDLRNVAPKNIYPLGEKFTGSDPAGNEISFTNYYMTLNGAPFYGISGELHFARVSPDQWEDAVVKMKCGGINIISTYVFWILHEEEEGIFRFDGCRDLRRFIEICEKHGMYVIVRIGPFNHGEMRNGGLPDWLYGKPYDVRDNNPGFLEATRRFFRQVHMQLDGHYYRQGGCIIGTQIDNEYQHSSAPWEITTGISSEWINGGTTGNDYMLALKKIMLEEGIITPFYTCTAWGGAATPSEEALPLWGGYSYQPWIFYDHAGEHPATPEYIYRDNHNNAVTSTYNFEPSYEPESRPYACCEMMGGMMCSYNYRFQMDMRAIDALANTKLGSGCNLLGYYMYKGGTNPTGRRTPFMNESQISKRSYDYQAAIGEFGQIRESYGRLRALHMLCTTFSGFIETTKAVLPDHMETMQPDDATRLRFSVRVNGDSGFLFINNFQDHRVMPDRKNEEVTLDLPGGGITFRFSIASGENAVLPFNIDLNGAKLVYATAQPMTHIGNTWFFMAPDGMSSEYCFDMNGEKQLFAPAAGESFTLGSIKVVTLSRTESRGFCKFDINGKERAFICEKPLVYDGENLKVETEDGTAVVKVYDGEKFIEHRFGSQRPGVHAGFRKVGIGRYVVDADPEMLKGHKQVLLRADYRGDIGHVFINGQMISDNFSNLAKWDVRLDCYADEMKRDPLTIYITPTKEKVTVDVSSAMAGRMERAEGLTAELIAAELVFVDDIVIDNI